MIRQDIRVTRDVSGDVLVDASGAVRMDRYMDPAHLQLGDEGYRNLQQKRVRTIGTELFLYMGEHRPELLVYSRESERKLNASPEGGLTEFVYEIRSTHNGRVPLFPTTLIKVSSDHGMMPVSTIAIVRGLQKDPALNGIARRLGKEHHFILKDLE